MKSKKPRRNLNTLQREAAKYCKLRGHKMSWIDRYSFSYDKIYMRYGVCKKCAKRVYLNPTPAPNEIDIGGEAVALNCN